MKTKKLMKSINRFEKNLKNAENWKKTLEQEIKDLKNSINSLWKINTDAKKILEEDLNKKISNLIFTNNNINYYSKIIETKKQELQNNLENHKKAYNNYQKEKEDFEKVHKQALDEHKKTVETNKEQNNFNSIKRGINASEISIKFEEENIKKWNENIKIKTEEINILNKEINSVYEGLRIAGINLVKPWQITDEDLKIMSNLRKINPKDSKIITFDNAYNMLVKYADNKKSLNNIISNLKNNIKNVNNKINEEKNKISNLEKQKLDNLAQAKQKWIDLKA